MAHGELTGTVVDLNLHGVVGIRLIGTGPDEIAAVERQLGPVQGPLAGPPDIEVTFVDSLPEESLRHVTFGKNGYSKDHFYILESNKHPVRVAIAFETIGETCRIVSERGVPSVPLLLAIANISALKKGYVALHASAFHHEGTGYLVCGWAKGGKTEALLSFGNHGARYVGDEWMWLSRDGDRILGVPENIRLWEWHLEFVPQAKRQLRLEKKLVFKGVHLMEALERGLRSVGLGRTFPVKLLNEMLPAFRRQLNIVLSPKKIFGERFGPFEGVADKVFLMASHESPEIVIERVSPDFVVDRMVSSIEFELMPFMEHYLAFKFAFPDRVNPFLEGLAARQREVLADALKGKETFIALHPYPVSLPSLFREIYRAAHATEG